MNENMQSRTMEKGVVALVPTKCILLSILVFFTLLFLFTAPSVLADNLADDIGNATLAQSAISKLAKELTPMQEAELPVERFEDALRDMNALFERQEYAQVIMVYDTTITVMEQMRTVEEDIATTETLLSEARRLELDVSGVLMPYNQALSEYEKANYEGASSSIIDAKSRVMHLLQGQTDAIIANAEAIAQSLNEENYAVQEVNETLNALYDANARRDFTTMFVLSHDLVWLNESTMALLHMRRTIKEFEQQDLSTTRFQDILTELEMLLTEGDQENFFKLYNDTQSLVLLAYETQDTIDEAVSQLSRPEVEGIDFSDAQDLLNLSRRELQLENYEKAKEHADNALALIEETEQSHLFASILNQAKSRFDFLTYLKTYWWQLLLGLVFFGFIVVAALYVLKVQILTANILHLKQERQSVKKLGKELQWDYYKKHTVDKESFNSTFEAYQRRQDEIDEEIPVLEGKLKRLQTMMRKSDKTNEGDHP